MVRPRIIPTLLLTADGLVKTRRFKDRVYIGDPINAVRIFSEKEADEILLLDIDASRCGRAVDLGQLASIASECFVPLGYGGGIRDAATVARIFAIGIEKIIINTAIHDNPTLVRDAVAEVGSQSVVASIDVNRDWWGKPVVRTLAGTRSTSVHPVEFASRCEDLGAGEILLTAIDRDGTMRGMDIELVRSVTEAVNVPVVASGGAGSHQDLARAIAEGGASGVAAGSLFVFQGPHRAVLISYPSQQELEIIGGGDAARALIAAAPRTL